MSRCGADEWDNVGLWSTFWTLWRLNGGSKVSALDIFLSLKCLRILALSLMINTRSLWQHAFVRCAGHGSELNDDAFLFQKVNSERLCWSRSAYFTCLVRYLNAYVLLPIWFITVKFYSSVSFRSLYSCLVFLILFSASFWVLMFFFSQLTYCLVLLSHS